LADQYAIEDQFNGMNATVAPEALPEGMLQLLTDGVIVANQKGQAGGLVQTRPGKRAQLASPLPGKIAYCKRYRDPTGVQHLICAVADTTSTTGYLYDWVKDANTAARLTSLGLFNSYLVQIDLLSTFAYIVGATDGNMRRTDLVSVFEIAESPTAPVSPATIALQPWATDSSNTASAWAPDTCASPPNVLNGQFLPFTGSNAGTMADWTNSGTVDWHCSTGGTTGDSILPGGVNWVRLDDAPSYIYQTTQIGNGVKANANNTFGGENGTGTGVTRYTVHFFFGAQYFTDSGGINDSVSATVIVYDASHSQIATLTQIFTPGITGVNTHIGHIFAFDFLTEIQPVYYNVFLGNGGTAARPGPNGPYLSSILCEAILPPVTFTNDGTNAYGPTVGINGLASISTGFPIIGNTTIDGDQSILFWGQMRLSHLFSTAQNFSVDTTISIPITLNVVPISLRARLNFKTASNLAGILSDPLQVLTATNGQVYLQTDVSTLTQSNGFGTNLNSILVMEIIFTSDTDLVSGTGLADKAMILSPLIFAGNLSINLDYDLRFTESTSNDPATELESGGSPFSAEFVPNGLQAAYTATLPAPVNTTGPQTTAFYNVYRQGGTFPDVFFRLEATLPVAGGVTTIPNFSWNGGTGIYTITSAITGNVDAYWNPTTRVYTSNVPDSDLQQAAYLFDHQGTPTGANAICVYQNRLTLSVGSILWISALTTGVSAGLYFNSAPAPSDPNYLIDGNVIPIGAQDGGTLGESIVRVVPYRGEAVVFFVDRTYRLSGIDNSNFSVYEDQAIRNIGLIAPNAVTLGFGKGVYGQVSENVLWFLSSRGLRNYNFNVLDEDAAYPISALLNPGSVVFGEALNAAAYAQCSVFEHADRLFLNAPGSSGSSTVDVTYVCALSNGATWTQWNLGEVLCGETFGGSDDQDELVICDGAGQISTIGNGNYGDTTVSTGTPAAVTMSGLCRRVALNGWALQANTVSAVVDVDDASVTFTIGVNSVGNTGPITWTEPITLTTGDDNLTPPHGNLCRVGGYVRGRYLELTFSVPSVLPTTVRNLQLKYVPSVRI
jgi:hypothetical protein